MPAGRPKSKATVSLEKIFSIHVGEFTKDGKVLPPKHEIWCDLRGRYSEAKSAKTIYTAALKWYQTTTGTAAENVNDISGENMDKSVSFETSLETSDASFDESNTSNDRSPRKKGKKIKIQFSPKVWRTIEPQQKVYNRKSKGSHRTCVRKYASLASGLWTNVFAKEISKHDDIPCCWSFKRNKIYLSGKKYLVFQAKCGTCKAFLVGHLGKKQEENENVVIDVEIFNVNLQKHTKPAKTVKLTSQAAKQLYLQNKSTTVIRRELLKNSTQMFKEPTSRIMTANAIRCGKYRERKKNQISQCPMTALSYLKASNLYMNCSVSVWSHFLYFTALQNNKNCSTHSLKRTNF